MWQHVLTVRDDELAVGDDDDVSSSVAEGGAHAGVPGNSRGWVSGRPGKPAPVHQHFRRAREEKHDIIIFLCLYLNSTH